MEFLSLSEWLTFNHIRYTVFQNENTYFWLESHGVYSVIDGGLKNAMTIFFFMKTKIISHLLQLYDFV